MLRLLVAMSPTILMVVYAQLVTKWRIAILSASAPETSDMFARLLIYVKDPLILSTYLAALGGSVAWVFVVERYDIGLAFPIYVGLTVLAVAMSGALLFDEPVGAARLLGIVLIVAGVALVSRS